MHMRSIGSRQCCFNGAAPARARNARMLAGERAENASTGPRPRGRGMQREVHDWEPWPFGFNGAAPARARNAVLYAWPDFALSQCFNGAAPARARNGSVQHRCRWYDARRFNGAAPARARNAPCVDRQHVPSGFNGAAPGRARNVGIAVAQTGRDQSFNGAAPARARNGFERAERRDLWASTGPRPGGRGMSDWRWPGRLVPFSFNGAAPARARNGNSVS